MEKTRRIIDKRVKRKFMMDDAYLNGYAKLCGWNGTLVYLSLCRHADINQSCFPSIKLISEQHKINPKSVQRGIDKLKMRNIIQVKRKRNRKGIWKNNTYILMDKSCWLKNPVQESVGDLDVQKTDSPKPEDSQGLIHESLGHTKETHKEGNKFKETHISNVIVVSKEPDEIMNIFNTINPMLNWGDRKNRNACVEMIEKFGFEETKKMAEAIIAVQGKQYAPTATTPYEMKEKIAKFKIYFDREGNSRIFM